MRVGDRLAGELAVDHIHALRQAVVLQSGRATATINWASSWFVELARSIYRHNDERSRFKQQLSELLGTPFGEQQQYAVDLEELRSVAPDGPADGA